MHLDNIDEAELGDDPFAQNDVPVSVDAGNEAWLKSDRDYTYQEVLPLSLVIHDTRVHILNSCLHGSTRHYTPPTHLFCPIHPKNDTLSRHPPFTVKETRNPSSQMSLTSARRCIVRFLLSPVPCHHYLIQFLSKPEHVIQFLFAEMGTTGSVDGAGRLVIRGRFQQKQVENVLRRYIGKPITIHHGHSSNQQTAIQSNT